MSDYPSGWSVRSLGEIAERVRRTSDDLNHDVLTISSTGGWVDQKKKWARNMAGKSLEKYTLLQHGEFSYNRGNSKTYPQGCVFRLKSWERALVPNVYHSFRITSPNVDETFLSHYFAEGGLNEQLRGVLTSSVRDNGLLNITADSFFASEVPIPPLPEQKKIAEILSGIDKVKDLLSKSINAKVNLRSALLSELIDDTASSLKIDLVAKRVSGHTPSKSNPGFWDGGIPWISLTDTSKLDDRYILNTAKEISAEGIANSSAVLHPPGVVVISRDARVGCSAITSREMAMSQHFVGWICSDKLFNKYLYYLLQKWKPKFEAIAMGSTIPTIGVPFFRDLEIPVPDISRQVQIAEMMEAVDIEIAALKAKICAVQNQKSAISADLLSGRKRVSI